MKELSRHPTATVCYCPRVRFRENANQIVFITTSASDIPFFPASKVRKGLLRSVTFLPSSVVIRKSTFQSLGGFATTFKVVEDWDMWLRLLHSGVKFVSCSEPLLLYRVHGSNVSSKTETVVEENMLVYRTRVAPHLTGIERWIEPRRYQSGYNVDRAFILREKGDSHCLAAMSRSLWLWPFGGYYRYKVWLHMLMTRLGFLKKVPHVGAE